MGNQITTIHEPGKIDIHKRKAKYEKALAQLDSDQIINPENRRLILEFLRDCALGKTLRGRAKKKIGPARCLKYLGILKRLDGSFGKSLDEVTQLDMEKFVEELENDRMRKRNGKPYSDATKCDIKKTIKKFWKWKDGDNKTYPELVEWIDTYESIKEVPALRRDEIEKMIEAKASVRDKALIMVLFDSGARVEELLNVRLKPEHLIWAEQAGCYKIRLEFSKTKPRTISLPISTSHLKTWLDIHPTRDNPDAQLFPMTYDALKMVVKRLGKRALRKTVTPHMLRHSSATYYANRLSNPYKLCYRYGWTMNSGMVNRYLDREGILEGETPEIVRKEEIGVANRENERLSEELALLRESHSELAGEFEGLSQELKALRDGKGILALLMELIRKRSVGDKMIGANLNNGFDLVLADGGRGSHRGGNKKMRYALKNLTGSDSPADAGN